MAEYEEIEPTDEDDDPAEVATTPKSSRLWLNLIANSHKVFEFYQTKCDRVDREFANLERLADPARDREFSIFWANIQVIGPSIYSRPPVAVVVPRFQDRRPVRKVASELLERVANTAFDLDDIDSIMLALRDDLTLNGRGAAWLRYEEKERGGGRTERVCIEHIDRKDFLHDPARKWTDVDWVARRAWLTKREMRKRFRKISGDAYQGAEYSVMKEDRDSGGSDKTKKAGVWEIWCKSEDRVYWIAEGVSVLLDEGTPHLTLDGFFPCPRPAYSTLQRRTLIPVPDFYQYVDQLDEINELTGRIHALADAILVRGFYPAGAGEIGDAIEAAIKEADQSRVMIPVSNWAAFGGVAAKDMIVWLPIDMIVSTVTALVEARRQLIDDVYQITGLSDIMRGQTAASETATAQQLKSQYGSVRIKDRQNELVRIARDIVRIAAEIIAENFDRKTLLDMSQMEMPTDADIQQQIKALGEQSQRIQAQAQATMQQAQSNPQIMQQVQANPEEAQQVMQQMQQQVQQQLQHLQAQASELAETVTIDQVMTLLQEQRLRPFILDIETDSTIAPDENAAKQRATEFVTTFGGFMQQAVVAAQQVPQIAPLMATALKYMASQFRVGREMDTAIDDFAEQMAQMGQQEKPDPAAQAEQARQQTEQQKLQFEMQKFQAEEQVKAQIRTQDEQRQAQIDAMLLQAEASKIEQERAFADEKHRASLEQMAAQSIREAERVSADIRLKELDIEEKQLGMGIKVASAQIDATMKAESAMQSAETGEF